MKIYRIKCLDNGKYVYKIQDSGDFVKKTKNGKVWFSETLARKSVAMCRDGCLYDLECYKLELTKPKDE